MNASRRFLLLLLLSACCCCCCNAQATTGSSEIPSIDVIIGEDSINQAIEDTPDGGIVNLIYKDGDTLKEDIILHDRNLTIMGQGKNGPRLFVDPALPAVFDILSNGVLRILDFNFIDHHDNIVSIEPSYLAETIITGTVEVISCSFSNVSRYAIIAYPDFEGFSFSNLVVKDSDFVDNAGAILIESVFESGGDEERSVHITGSTFVRHSEVAISFNGILESGDAGTSRRKGPPAVNIIGCEFSGNLVGGLSATNVARMNILDSKFNANSASDDFSVGGAAYISKCDFLDIQGSTFEKNYAVDGGGALFLSTLRILRIRHTSFTDNSCDAERGVGGGLYWEDHEAGQGIGGVTSRVRWSVNIENCTFVGNKASSGGGLLAWGRNEKGGLFGGFRVVTSLFHRNEATGAAGGISFISDSALRLGDTTFSENKADSGGGIAMRLGALGRLDLLRFYNNTAKSSGGGIHARSLRVLLIRESEFVDGLASEGGAVMLDGVQQADITGSGFLRNQATLGGGVVHVGRSLIQNALTVRACGFEENVATHLIDYQNLDGLREPLKGGGGALALIELENPDKGTVDAQVIETAFVDNKGYSGGAMFVATNKGSAFNELNVEVSQCRFQGNTAGEAGGIILVDRVDGITVQCEDGDPHRSLKDLFPDFCPDWKAAQALPYEDPSGDKLNEVNEIKPSQIPFGDVAASTLVGTMKAVPSKSLGSLSGRPLQRIDVYPFDLFGQEMTSSILGRPIEVRPVTDHPNLTLTGTTMVEAVNGSAAFDQLIIIGDPGNYTLNMTGHLLGSLGSGRASVQLDVGLRDCIIGEVAQDSSLFGCFLCSNGLYSFNTMNSTCDACPKNANCSASIQSDGVLERRPLVPLNGYWHSTPFSLQMHLCLSSDTCDFDGRIQLLQSPDETGAGQCRPGHSGILCGACDKGFGHSSVGECTKCQPTWIYTMVITFTMLVSLFLVVATLRGNLLTERRQDVFEAQGVSLHIPLAEISCCDGDEPVDKSRTGNRENANANIDDGGHTDGLDRRTRGEGSNGNCMVHEDRGETIAEDTNVSGCLDSQLNREKPDAFEETVHVLMKVGKASDPTGSHSHAEKSHGSDGNRVYVHVNVSRTKPPDSAFTPEKSLGRNSTPVQAERGRLPFGRQSTNVVSLASASVIERAIGVGGENDGEVDDPGLKVAELIKIMINFSQVTGTAFIIDFDWPPGIKQMVGLQDVVSATSAAWTAIECAMPANAMVTESMSALLLQMSTPVIMSVLLVCFWLSRAAYIHCRVTTLNFRGYLVPRLLVSAWSIVFFFYDSWTESFMKLLYCPSVDKYDESQPYFEFSTATSRVWAQDTSVTCFRGVHKVLFYGIGLPGLVLFSLGVPLAMFLFIVYNRQRLTDPIFRVFYGFMYLNYDIEYAYWESAIMVRKALIVAIAILGHSLGKSLQGVLMFAVIFGAVVVHTITRPLPLDLLDNMETVSLGTTACTFFSAVVFSQSKVDKVGRLLLSIFVYGVNIGFVLHFAATFIRAVHEYVVSYKEEDEEMTREAPDEHVGFSQKAWYLVVTRPLKTAWRYLRKVVPTRGAS